MADGKVTIMDDENIERVKLANPEIKRQYRSLDTERFENLF